LKVSDRIRHVNAVYSSYANALSSLPFLSLIPVSVEQGELPLYVEVLCSERKMLMDYLAEKGIQARPLPPSLHTSSYLNNCGDFSNSTLFSEQGMYLPCGPGQSLENIGLVLNALKGFRI